MVMRTPWSRITAPKRSSGVDPRTAPSPVSPRRSACCGPTKRMCSTGSVTSGARPSRLQRRSRIRGLHGIQVVRSGARDRVPGDWMAMQLSSSGVPLGSLVTFIVDVTNLFSSAASSR